MRRVAVSLGLALLLTGVAGGALSLRADAAGAPVFGSYTLTATAQGFEMSEDQPSANAHPEGGGMAPYSTAALTNGPLGYTLGAVAWPGATVGNAGGVVGLLFPSQVVAPSTPSRGLTQAADRHRFILVAPFITSYDGLRNRNCWGFWFEQHRHEGRGEAEDLHRIAREVESRFGVDPARRYIAGLSSGAAMAVIEAIAYNEYWAAAASAAGLPYGEDAASVSFSGQCPGSATLHRIDRVVADMRAEVDDRYPIPLMVLQNTRDCTVIPRAADNLRDAHLRLFGDAAHDTPEEALAAERACAPVNQADFDCRHFFYTLDGTPASRSLVESIRYNGPIATPDMTDTDHGHYWIGGADGRDGRWAVRRGPSYPDIIWDFFARHPRDGSGPTGQPRITINGANPLRVGLGDPFVDPGATATDPEDGTLAVSADCSSVDTSRAGDYACTYRAVDRDGNSATATRIVVVSGAPRCTPARASPAMHIAAGRAVRGGPFNLRALSRDDGIDIGFGWDTWSLVTLYEGESGRWYARLPAGCAA